MLQPTISPARRLSSRVEIPEDVWVYWCCNARDDVSRVRDLSMGGLFLETVRSNLVDATTRLDFLVQEGRIMADAVVRHVRRGQGIGLKFTAVNNEDWQRLAVLINRLHRSS